MPYVSEPSLAPTVIRGRFSWKVIVSGETSTQALRGIDLKTLPRSEETMYEGQSTLTLGMCLTTAAGTTDSPLRSSFCT